MTEAEEQELFARLEKLERSAWRWRVFASVLGVLFLLLLSLGLVSAVAVRNAAAMRERLAVEEDLAAERRARVAADEAAQRQRVAEEQRRVNEAEARRRRGQGAKVQVEEAIPQRPAGDDPQGP
jgi:hypothetical protein